MEVVPGHNEESSLVADPTQHKPASLSDNLHEAITQRRADALLKAAHLEAKLHGNEVFANAK